MAGEEPAQEANGFAASWLWRRHEVSILNCGAGRRRLVARPRAAREGLDDDHAATATGAGMRLTGIGAAMIDGVIAGLRGGEQFAGSRDVLGTRATGEQA